MDERIRRMVAYAAAGRKNNHFSSSIYSYENGGYANMSKSFDYDASSHFSGAENGNMFHYGLGAHVQLKLEGARFSGYDYASGSHFQGQIRDSAVQLYDYGAGQYFNYTV